MSISILEEKVSHFTNAIKKSLDNENWYAALTLTLTLPDICSKIGEPDVYTSSRYPDWFNKYVGQYYIHKVGPHREEHVFLNGNDAYALRCSFLHQGETNIKGQRAQRVLENFMFTTPSKGGYVHNNKIDHVLQLQVDQFCIDVIKGVEEWVEEHKEDVSMGKRAKKMIDIKTSFIG